MTKPSLILLLSLLLSSCSNDMKSIKATIQQSMLNEENAKDITILYSKEGNTKASLYTPSFRHMQHIAPTYVEMNQGLTVTFFDDELHPQSTLSAKYGKLFEEKGNVLVRDSVVVTNIKGEMLQTEQLIWDEKLQLFYTDKFVKITTPTRIIYGDGLESNQYFTEYRIHNVKGIIGVEASQLPGTNPQ